MNVDEIVNAFRAQHSFAAGPKSSIQGFSWKDFVADSVFERLPGSRDNDLHRQWKSRSFQIHDIAIAAAKLCPSPRAEDAP